MKELKFLAYDSFSTRSMATYVETDIKILLDPSISISPNRYRLPPHPLELQALEKDTYKIIDYIKKSNVLVITHYHWDHCPHPDSEIISNIINKTLIVKDYASKINKSQNSRGKRFLSKVKKKNEILVGDSRKYDFGDTTITISKPVWHGTEGSKLGYVIMACIQYKNNSLLFASDIQGVLSGDTLNEILSLDPTILVLSGPATYHNFWDEKLTEISNENLKKIAEKTQVKEIVIDHHLVRDKDYFYKIKELKYHLESLGVSLKTAAEYMKIDNRLLEARRKELYKMYPAHRTDAH